MTVTSQVRLRDHTFCYVVTRIEGRLRSRFAVAGARYVNSREASVHQAMLEGHYGPEGAAARAAVVRRSSVA